MTTLNQAVTMDELTQHGWQLSRIDQGFVYMYLRDRSEHKNYVMPEYWDITIFPNGRIADGEVKKYPRWRKR